MSNSFRDSLDDLLQSDTALHEALWPKALQLAIGNRVEKGVVEDETTRKAILLKMLDVVEHNINAIAFLSHELACSDNDFKTKELRNSLIKTCCDLSALDEALCGYQNCTTVSFESLCQGQKAGMVFGEMPWYETMLRELPSWLYKVSLHAKDLNVTLEEDIPGIGKGYVNNFEILDPECLPDDLEGRDKLLKDYQEAGVPPFIMRVSDYHEFVNQAFIEKFGCYDSSDSIQLRLYAKMKSLAVGFETVIDGRREECVVASPAVFGIGWFRSYSSSEKRWLIDISRPASWDLSQIGEMVIEGDWLQPQSLAARSFSS